MDHLRVELIIGPERVLRSAASPSMKGLDADTRTPVQRRLEPNSSQLRRVMLAVCRALAQLAVAGELFSAEAKRRSLAGMLIEGSCRDTETIARVSRVIRP